MTPMFLIAANADGPPAYECLDEVLAKSTATAGGLHDLSGLVAGEVVIAPMSQAYFWTKAWQEGERQADAEIASGNVHEFNSMAEAINALRSDD